MNTQVVSGNATLCQFRFDEAEFDESRLELLVGGLPIELEQKPLKVLVELLHHRGEVVSRDDLLHKIWAGRVTVNQVLSNAVAKLRKALGSRAARRIVTVPGVGYRFDGPVEQIAVQTRHLSEPALTAGDAVPGCPDFAVHERLASSAGSEVWLARNPQKNELRVFKFAYDDARLVSLRREITLSRFLNGALADREDLIRIMGVSVAALPGFMASEYGGPDLLQWSTESNELTSMSTEERLHVFQGIVDAVAATHRVGVLHTNLQPRHVLVTNRPAGGVQVRVADFGSGRLIGPRSLEELEIAPVEIFGRQETIATAGRASLHVAPEVLAGRSPTAQSDVYSLGVMLYQIVIGDFKKPMASGWEQDITDELLVEDIAASTQGDPARRLTSVAELNNRLQSRAARRVERASLRATRARSALAERAREHARIRRPWVLSALGALLLSLGMGFSPFRGNYTLHPEASVGRNELKRGGTRAESAFRFRGFDMDNANGVDLATSTAHLHGIMKRLSGSWGNSTPPTKGVLGLP